MEELIKNFKSVFEIFQKNAVFLTVLGLAGYFFSPYLLTNFEYIEIGQAVGISLLFLGIASFIQILWNIIIDQYGRYKLYRENNLYKKERVTYYKGVICNSDDKRIKKLYECNQGFYKNQRKLSNQEMSIYQSLLILSPEGGIVLYFDYEKRVVTIDPELYEAMEELFKTK